MMAHASTTSPRKLAAFVLIAVVALIAAAALAWMMGSTNDVDAIDTGRSFYTVDDGATLFEADADLLPPFDHHGKPAVRAAVYTCDGTNRFVMYLERLTPAGKQMVTKMRAGPSTGGRVAFNPALLNETELKRPGEGEWVRQADVIRSATILQSPCPHDGIHAPRVIVPD